MTKITILSENTVPVSFGLLAEHGFSVHIQKGGKNYLFDTGQSGIVVHNADVLGIDLKNTTEIILSHGHYDHCNGLDAVLRRIQKPIKILCHSRCFEKKYVQMKNGKNKYIGIQFQKNYLTDYHKAQIEKITEWTEVEDNLFITGEVPLIHPIEKIPDAFFIQKEDQTKEKDLFYDDNSLVIKTSKGLVLILGCAHRGIMNIGDYVSQKLKTPLYGIIGGFHLHDASQEHFQAVLDWIAQKNIQLLAPAHCTGISKIMEIQKQFSSITQPAFCGTIFELPE